MKLPIKRKVILISIDGMRPDGFLACGNPFAEEMRKQGAYTLDATTCVPPVTLPCHMALFHSVPPQRHGTLTNDYVPMLSPVQGLFEQIRSCGGRNAIFWGWEPLRDVAKPLSMEVGEFVCALKTENSDEYLADRAILCAKEKKPDFIFLYMVETDEKGGHAHGWMSEEYCKIIGTAVEQVKKVLAACGDEYTVLVTADHGGHDRMHGLEIPEDMTIPMFFFGPEFPAGRELHDLHILDLAPTVTDIMGLPAVPEWEGHSILEKL